MTILDRAVLMEMAAKANAMRWFEHVLRAEKYNSVRIVLKFAVRGKKEERAPGEHRE